MLRKFFLFIILQIFLLPFAHAGAIHFMTYNIACLPTIFGSQINKDFLRPNNERVNEVIQVITQLNTRSHASDVVAPNIISFEEAFDPAVRSLLKSKLNSFYPHNSGDMGQKILNAGSGLLLFSQYPILNMRFFPYTNIMIGDEILANKGFIIAKLKYSDNYFITVVITHLEAGDAIFKDQQSKFGTTSFRRGVQMGEINSELQKSGNTSPAGYENLRNILVFLFLKTLCRDLFVASSGYS